MKKNNKSEFKYDLVLLEGVHVETIRLWNELQEMIGDSAFHEYGLSDGYKSGNVWFKNLYVRLRRMKRC